MKGSIPQDYTHRRMLGWGLAVWLGRRGSRKGWGPEKMLGQLLPHLPDLSLWAQSTVLLSMENLPFSPSNQQKLSLPPSQHTHGGGAACRNMVQFELPHHGVGLGGVHEKKQQCLQREGRWAAFPPTGWTFPLCVSPPSSLWFNAVSGWSKSAHTNHRLVVSQGLPSQGLLVKGDDGIYVHLIFLKF